MPAGEPLHAFPTGPYEESFDGLYLYFKGEGGSGYGTLWRVPVEGGEKEEVLTPFTVRSPLVSREEGLYFIPAELGDDGLTPLNRLGPDTGTITEVARARFRGLMRFSLSPDRRFLLTTRPESIRTDILLVDEFR
jgi:hypothetical protein